MGSTNILNTRAYTGSVTITSIPDIYGTCYDNYIETDSNELKINIKKFQIKFNFNL